VRADVASTSPSAQTFHGMFFNHVEKVRILVILFRHKRIFRARDKEHQMGHGYLLQSTMVRRPAFLCW
jgi:hypothetical protein